MSGRGFAAGHGIRMALMMALVFVVITLIAITVGRRPTESASASPSASSPGVGQTETDAPVTLGAERWKSSVQNREFELALDAAKDTFSADETLDVVASLTYLGPDQRAMIGSDVWGPIEFFMKAPGMLLLPTSPGSCTELDLDRGATLKQNLLDLEGQPHAFRVAHGLHEIGAFAAFRTGGCHGPSADLRTTIVVAVSDGPDDIPLYTDVSSEQSACLLMRNGGQLVQSNTGLGVVDARGSLHQVVWPKGYSARRTADGAVLLGRAGQVIAHEGDHVIFDAVDNGGPLWPCGEVEVEPPTSP